MKLWLFTLLLGLVGCGVKEAENQPVGIPFELRVEAEATNNQLNGIARRSPCTQCSKHEGVADLGWGSFIVAPVVVPKSGVYKLALRYSLGFSETRSGMIYVNNYPVGVINLPWTEGWDNFKTASVAIKLEEGRSYIKLGNPSYWFVPLDYLEISSDLGEVQNNRSTFQPNRQIFVLADVHQIWGWIFWLALGVAVGCMILWKLFSQRQQPWFRSVALSLVGVVLFSTLTLVGYLLELLDMSLAGSWLGFNFWNCCFSLIAVAMLAFALAYTGNLPKSRDLVYWVLGIYSLVCIGVFAMDPWLHLVLQNPNLTLDKAYLPLQSGGLGNGYRFFFSVSITMIFIAAGLLLASSGYLSATYRKQVAVLLASIMSPFLVGYTLGWILWQHYDIGQINLYAIGASASLWVIAYAVFNLRLPELTPTLWGTAQRIPSDLALVVDAQNRIIEFNTSARDRLSLSIGQNLPTELGEPRAELDLAGRSYQRNSQLFEADTKGELIVLHDITERVRAERALRDANSELQRLRDELRDQANKDALTGLFNRRYLDRQLALEVEQAVTQGTDLSLVLFDVDYFRDINSRFGYAGGDQVLRGIGQLVTAGLEPNVLACRFGGEEFCVILPGYDLEKAEAFAKGLQAELRTHRFEINDRKIGIDISAACASLGENKGQGLLLVVDETLRQAKRTGRNKVLRAKPLYVHWGTGWV